METKFAVIVIILSAALLLAFPAFHFLALGVLLYHVVIFAMAMTHDGDLLLMLYEKWGKDGSNLNGQVAWITGASSGIGEALAYELARKGVKLILSARREQELQRVKERCLAETALKSEDILVLPLDMLDYATHKECAEKAVAHFQKVDILVNNAGRSQRSLCKETSLDVVQAIMDLNFISQLSITKAILPHMLGRKAGHIVNISSTSGRVPTELTAAYTGTKHALLGYFSAFAYENDDLSVTNVCPGPVESDIVGNAFGKEMNSGRLKTPARAGERGPFMCMSAERCATLIVVAVANKLPEVWICKNTVMLVMQMYNVAPTLTQWIKKKVYGNKRIDDFKKSQEGSL